MTTHSPAPDFGAPDTARIAIGLMSGTSMDGIDAALMHTDGVTVTRLGPSTTLAYPDSLRDRLRAAMENAASLVEPDKDSADVRVLERDLTDAHEAAVRQLLKNSGYAPTDIDVVGFHGQTLVHRPDRGWTWQIGDGGRLAGRLSMPVINDFRAADVAGGGQGAPLVPVYHAALAARGGRHRRLAVVNIGGVANVTWIDLTAGAEEPALVAFDTGPGNAVVDDWVRHHSGAAYDADGAMASSGMTHSDVLLNLMDSSYFADSPPKSLDRADFTMQAVRGLGAADGASTLTDFVVEGIVAAQEHFPAPVDEWYICGGGRHNTTLMKRLRRRLPVMVEPVEALGWRGDALEAEAFAFLAVRRLRGLPLTYPGTTGCARPVVGGVLHLPHGVQPGPA
ncbi:anhydro-N-acetylmuramic acid kinase [Yunchengibacter salinarum]|uniref:anhydro-N-acetylmuramic acid kinase n=1 Tax=Yunchengibacter salinarum TaxID=3133399 RepID=UPI0035B5E7C3